MFIWVSFVRDSSPIPNLKVLCLSLSEVAVKELNLSYHNSETLFILYPFCGSLILSSLTAIQCVSLPPATCCKGQRRSHDLATCRHLGEGTPGQLLEKGPRDHINLGTLQTMVSAILLVLGLRTRM